MGRNGVGLELATGGAVRGVVLVKPALEKAEPVLCVQAAPVGVHGRRRLQGHHELVVHGTVDTAVGDIDGHGLGVDGHRDRARAGGVGGPSANAGNLQEREDRLEVLE